ncbi:hypothetical protein DFH06DRAFT_1292920 [Mycena polygramma]|nr:hypothetical protein DFH06DRAFT_1292920 [Mycena polygramma]
MGDTQPFQRATASWGRRGSGGRTLSRRTLGRRRTDSDSVAAKVGARRRMGAQDGMEGEEEGMGVGLQPSVLQWAAPPRRHPVELLHPRSQTALALLGCGCAALGLRTRAAAVLQFAATVLQLRRRPALHLCDYRAELAAPAPLAKRAKSARPALPLSPGARQRPPALSFPPLYRGRPSQPEGQQVTLTSSPSISGWRTQNGVGSKLGGRNGILRVETIEMEIIARCERALRS